jgi:predicted Fe-Mo cluster-binding NifX family protein
MRVAIPMSEGRVSPSLDTAPRLMILVLMNRRVISHFEIPVEGSDLHRRWLQIRNLGLDVVLCHGVSQELSRMLSCSGIKLIRGSPGQPEALLKSHIDGTLAYSKYLMPGSNLPEFEERAMSTRSKKTTDERPRNFKDS